MKQLKNLHSRVLLSQTLIKSANLTRSLYDNLIEIKKKQQVKSENPQEKIIPSKKPEKPQDLLSKRSEELPEYSQVVIDLNPTNYPSRLTKMVRELLEIMVLTKKVNVIS